MVLGFDLCSVLRRDRRVRVCGVDAALVFNFYFKKMYLDTTATFAPRLTNIHRDNKRNRHSPRQQAFSLPPPPTTDRHSFISINGKLTCCSEASALCFQAHSI
jgi:hypothetical protein